jgi:ferredoxin
MKPDENSPKHFLVTGSAAPKCIGCMDCLENCPQDAISIEITLPEFEEGEHPYKHPFESLEVGMENQKLIDELDAKYERFTKK